MVKCRQYLNGMSNSIILFKLQNYSFDNGYKSPSPNTSKEPKISPWAIAFCALSETKMYHCTVVPWKNKEEPKKARGKEAQILIQGEKNYLR